MMGLDLTTLVNQLNAITQGINSLNTNLTALFGSTTNGFTVNGILTTKSGIVRNVRFVTAAGAVTVAVTDDIIVIDKGTGAATAVNFPASPTKGQCWTIKDGKGDANTHNITLTPSAGTIDGSATYVISTIYGSAIVTYNGNEYSVLASH